MLHGIHNEIEGEKQMIHHLVWHNGSHLRCENIMSTAFISFSTIHTHTPNGVVSKTIEIQEAPNQPFEMWQCNQQQQIANSKRLLCFSWFRFVFWCVRGRALSVEIWGMEWKLKYAHKNWATWAKCAHVNNPNVLENLLGNKSIFQQ